MICIQYLEGSEGVAGPVQLLRMVLRMANRWMDATRCIPPQLWSETAHPVPSRPHASMLMLLGPSKPMGGKQGGYKIMDYGLLEGNYRAVALASKASSQVDTHLREYTNGPAPESVN